MSKDELATGLKHGHEYQWTYLGIDYSLLPGYDSGGVYFVVKGQGERKYPDVDAVIQDGFDLVAMTTDNPTLDEY